MNSLPFLSSGKNVGAAVAASTDVISGYLGNNKDPLYLQVLVLYTLEGK